MTAKTEGDEMEDQDNPNMNRPGEYVRGQRLLYGHYGSSPNDPLCCSRCGCDTMARLSNASCLSKDRTYVCRDCGMEHDCDGAIIGEAKVSEVVIRNGGK